MTCTHHLPRDKFDEAAVQSLDQLAPPLDPAVVSGLFEWTADVNWPISGEVMRLLLRAPEQIVPHVTAVFRGDDGPWKSSLISLIIGRGSRSAARSFRSELVRLSTSADPIDIQEGILEFAAEAVTWIDGDEKLPVG